MRIYGQKGGAVMRFIYFSACISVAISNASQAMGIDASPFDLGPLHWLLVAGYLGYGIAAFWWKPN
jgi:hypothetical protein